MSTRRAALAVAGARHGRNRLVGHTLQRMTTPDALDFDPDAPGTGGCLWVEIPNDDGKLEWVHFFGLSHNAFVEMSKTARTPPWQSRAEPPDGEISF
jgi:hypothetical protein